MHNGYALGDEIRQPLAARFAGNGKKYSEEYKWKYRRVGFKVEAFSLNQMETSRWNFAKQLLRSISFREIC